jgi:hypothetical protein
MILHVEITMRWKSAAAVPHTCEASMQKQYEGRSDCLEQILTAPQLTGCRDLHSSEGYHKVGNKLRHFGEYIENIWNVVRRGDGDQVGCLW